MSSEISSQSTFANFTFDKIENLDRQKDWLRYFVFFILGLVSLVVLYQDAALSFLQIWLSSEAYKHCFFIIPIVLFLLYDRKVLFNVVQPQHFWWGLALVPLVGILWKVGDIVDANIVRHFSFILFLQVLLLSQFGYRSYRTFLFPFLYLFFLIPTGDYFTLMLQDITAFLGVLLLKMTLIPVYQEGHYISIPTGQFYVAEACAGLRFLVANVVLGVLFSNLFYRTTYKRILYGFSSILIPILANGLRVYGVIMIAYLSNNKYGIGVDHLIYGWFFFFFVLMIIISIGLYFREDTKSSQNEYLLSLAQKNGVVSPVDSEKYRFTPIPQHFFFWVLFTFLAAFPVYLSSQMLDNRSTKNFDSSYLSSQLDSLYVNKATWVKESELDKKFSALKPVFPQADMIYHRSFTQHETRLSLFVIHESFQDKNKDIYAYENKVLGEDLVPAGIDSEVITILGHSIPITLYHFSQGTINRNIIAFYFSDNRFFNDKRIGKLLQIKTQILGQPTQATQFVIMFETPGFTSTEKMIEMIQEFFDHTMNLDQIIQTLNPQLVQKGIE